MGETMYSEAMADAAVFGVYFMHAAALFVVWFICVHGKDRRSTELPGGDQKGHEPK